MGGNDVIVEVDETFIGHDYTVKPKREKTGRGESGKGCCTPTRRERRILSKGIYDGHKGRH